MLSDGQLLIESKRIIEDEVKNLFVTPMTIANRIQIELKIDQQKALNILERIFLNI